MRSFAVLGLVSAAIFDTSSGQWFYSRRGNSSRRRRRRIDLFRHVDSIFICCRPLIQLRTFSAHGWCRVQQRWAAINVAVSVSSDRRKAMYALLSLACEY